MTAISDLPGPLKILYDCRGFYQCPKDANGKRLGPLVGYAGRDSQGCQKVGDVYANWAAAEKFPHQYKALARDLFSKIHQATKPSARVFCGMPMGGLSIANLLALQSTARACRYIYMEKKVTAPAAPGAREKSQLVWGRHCANLGDQVIIVEDVCNNFSTTHLAIDLIQNTGAEVTAIACLLNRSTNHQHEYLPARGGTSIPIISLVYLPFDQWRQTDDAVVNDIAAGNIVPKPKNEWDKLMEAMEQAS